MSEDATKFSREELNAVRLKLCQWATWVAISSCGEAMAWLNKAGRAFDASGVKLHKDATVESVCEALEDLGKVNQDAQKVVLVNYLTYGNQRDKALQASYNHARYCTLLKVGILYLAGKLTTDRNAGAL